MMGLFGCKRISTICSAVLSQYRRVTERQTGGQTDGIIAIARCINERKQRAIKGKLCEENVRWLLGPNVCFDWWIADKHHGLRRPTCTCVLCTTIHWQDVQMRSIDLHITVIQPDANWSYWKQKHLRPITRTEVIWQKGDIARLLRNLLSCHVGGYTLAAAPPLFRLGMATLPSVGAIP